jgi:plastocyanin
VAASLLVMGVRRYAFLLACTLLGSAVAVLPAVAGSETAPTVNAESSVKTCGTYYPNCWSPSQLELASPGTVAFQNSSGTAHGVVWSSVPATPTCTGVPVSASAVSFNGTCSFSQTGTYRFYCYVHGPSMSGTITVNPGGASTTTTSGSQPGATTTTTSTSPSGTTSTPTGGSGSPSSAPAQGTAATVLLARSQRGRAVRGSVQVPSADAGGRLEIDLLASRASMAKAGAAKPARVGRLVRSSLHAGKLSFSVPVNARARGALARHRRLTLTVKIVLTPLQGSPTSTTRNIALHP